MAHKTSPSRLTSDTDTWFDRQPQRKQDLICVGILLLITYVLFNEIIFKNMLFATGGDTAAALSWAKAVEHIKEVEKVSPLWIPYIFGGMPLAGALWFPDNVNYGEILLQLFSSVLFLGSEMHWLVLHYFLMGLWMFLLVRQMGFSSVPSMFAALTAMLNPYAIGLAQSGHGSKLMTLAFVPLLFFLTYNLFQRRDILSLGLLSAVVGTLLLNRHPQIAYYGLLLIGAYALYDGVHRRKEMRMVLGNFLLFVLALGLGFAIYAYEFLPTQEYAQYSIRGGGDSGAAGGLNYDYATNWSFHPFETLNYLIPSFFGFETPYYWGWMPFTDATVYIGIVPILLGIIALIYARNRETLFLAVFSAFVLLVSFGKHLPIVYDLMFNYFPYFNKFRAPSMILHMMPITFGILAAYGFTAFVDLQTKLKEQDVVKIRKRFTMAAAAIGAILVLGFLGKDAVYDITSGFMYEKENDLQQLQQSYGPQAQQVLVQLKRMRFDLLWKDYVKFAIIAGAAIGLLVFYLKRRLKPFTLGLGLLAILTIDLLILSTKYINPKPRADIERTFAPDPTVQFLKSDTTLHRIFPLGALFQDNSWMYHTIQSIGGYSPAKLKIFQEILDSCLYRGWDQSFPLNTNIVDMLNVKYALAQGRLPDDRFTVVSYDQGKNIVTHENRRFMPRAWFVDSVLVAGNKRNVFSLLNSPAFDPRTTAILEQPLTTSPLKPDSTAVRMVSHGAHRIELIVFTSHSSLLVLSEIYYPPGWKAYIDGTETPIHKTNYILRSVLVPSGIHTVTFISDFPVYREGMTITNIAWGIAGVLILWGLYQNPSIRAKLVKRHTSPKNA